MATIHIDGKEYPVDGAQNLLQACLSLGLDIPYFCWHPALGSVGACRQCAVKQFNGPDDKKGRLVMSCMTPVEDNSWIAIDDAEAKEFRASVIEFLMTNHPHDCPVCEEGGNCHLQDMTVLSGHTTRRYQFTKRTHANQDLGPFINHEMNRCIACYRCVRYYQDYAGGSDLGVFGAHNNVYFGRVADGTLESEFSGNLTEICPTGVFTDKTHSTRYNRKWDMQFAPSICQQCAVGCNISPSERYGELRRIENRYHGTINHYFLCDRGRFGYGYVNDPKRPLHPQLRIGTEWQQLTADTAIATIGKELQVAKRLIGIGSPRASLEANFQLRELVGAENFYSGLGATEWAQALLILEILQTSGARTPSLREMEQADAVLVLGEDVMQTAPRIALALRQSSLGLWRELAAEKGVPAWHAAAVKNIGQHEKNPLFIGSFAPTRLDASATATYQAAPEDLARLGYAIAHAIDSQAPAVPNLDADIAALAQRIATALLDAKRPLLVSGSGAQSLAILNAVANITKALHMRDQACEIALVLPEVNSLGAALLGGAAVEAALEELTTGTADAAVILENDLYQRCADPLVDAALRQTKTLVVLDHQHTRTTAQATTLLSAASFAEADGTVVNSEGRAQRFFQVYDPTYYDQQREIRESWSWLAALHSHMQGQAPNWLFQFSEVTHACAQAIPALAPIVDTAPDADFRIQGLKIARSPKRYSGRTAMRANLSVHEPRTSQDSDSPLTFSMEGYTGPLEPGALTPFAWAPNWNSPAAWNKFQEKIGGSLRGGDPGVRLLEPATQPTAYHAAIPAAFAPQPDTWRVLPLYHIFGSDELSALTLPIQERIPAAYVALSANDAQRLGLTSGTLVRITLLPRTWQFPVQIIANWPVGTIGVPRLPSMPVLTDATWVKVTL